MVVDEANRRVGGVIVGGGREIEGVQEGGIVHVTECKCTGNETDCEGNVRTYVREQADVLITQVWSQLNITTTTTTPMRTTTTNVVYLSVSKSKIAF